jgi:aspartyl-tRNA(Asn)/glutamyl-tRNA(Gln) amidotransferase subunit C
MGEANQPMSLITNQKVSAEEVRHIAALSNLHLTPDEETSMQKDLNAILEYVAELNELDTSSVIPMAQVGEMLAQREEDSRRVLRHDLPAPSLDRTAVMSSAPETDGVFFKVPRVIER